MFLIILECPWRQRKLELALKVKHQQMYPAHVQREADSATQSLQEAKRVSEPESWEHSQLSPLARPVPASRPAFCFLEWEAAFPSLTQPHLPQGSVPGFPNSTKHPSFHGVPSLTSVMSRSSSHFCLQVVLLYASTYVLVSLSIDRYHAIVHPMKFLQGGELPQPTAVL